MFLRTLILFASFILGSSLPALSAEPTPHLSIAEAEELLRLHIFRSEPMTPSDYTPKVIDMTTPEIWQNLGAQVFKFEDMSVRNGCGVLIKGGQVHWLGGCVGGRGLLSLALADLNANKSPELYYSYSLGPVIHRSEIGVYTEHRGLAQTDPWKDSYLGGELFLEKTDEKTIRVRSRQGETPVTIGKVVFRHKWSGPSVTVQLDPKLPKKFRDNLWSKSFPKWGE